MNFWSIFVKRKYINQDRNIGIIVLCGTILFLIIGSILPKVFASDKNPVIQVNLESTTPKSSKINDEITVTYNINPNTFNANVNNNTEYKEIAVLIDNSSSILNLKELYNNMLDVFTNSKEFKSKITIITYNSDISYKEFASSLIEYQGDVHRYTESIRKIDNDNRNLGSAINKAVEIFNNSEMPNSIKNIIIIGSGDPTFDGNPENDINKISTNYKGKYNIITLDTNTGTHNDQTLKSLKEWHKALGGPEENYFCSNKNGSDNVNYINNEARSEIVKRVKGCNIQSYSIINAKLNFDLDNNFDYVQNSASSNITNVEIDGSKLTFDLPTINYRATTQNSDGTYIHSTSTFTISFKIKPKEGKTGELGFASDSDDLSENLKNYISYNKLDNKLAKEHIDTPVITIVDGKLPKINAEVFNPPNTAKLGEPIPIEYKIMPEKFNKSSISNDSVHKDAVFALDISKSKRNGESNPNNGSSWTDDEENKVEAAKSAIYDTLINMTEAENQRYGITTYSNRVNDSYNLTDPKQLADKIRDIQSEVNGASQVKYGDSEAERILESLSNYNNAKYVVIISSGHGNGKTQLGPEDSIIEDGLVGPYTRIAIDLSDYSTTEEIKNRINSIFNEIENSKPLSYAYNAKLKFHTAGKFSAVSGIKTSSDSWYDLETPEFDVKYKLDSNGDYVPEEVGNVTFSILANNLGDLEFGDIGSENNLENKFPGAVSYKSLVEEQIYNRISPFPIAISNSQSIKILEHGLYEGVKDKVPSIDEGKNDSRTFNYQKGININLGVALNGSIGSESEDLKLKVPFKLETDPVVYIYDSDGVLHEVGEMYLSSSDAGQDTYKYRGEQISDKNILILYREIPQNAGMYINHLYVKDMLDVPVTIKVNDNAPDLF